MDTKSPSLQKALEEIRLRRKNVKKSKVKNDDLIPISLNTAKYISLDDAIEALDKLDQIKEVIDNVLCDPNEMDKFIYSQEDFKRHMESDCMFSILQMRAQVTKESLLKIKSILEEK